MEEIDFSKSYWRNQMDYEDLPKWRKFLYGWSFSIKHMGIKGLIKFPFIYYKLWKLTR